jgi:hypothetical protein
MPVDLDKFSFEQWVAFVFAHPVKDGDSKDWYWQKVWDYEVSNELSLEYLIRLFRNPSFLLDAYSSEQIEQDFWFLHKPSGFLAEGMSDPNVAWSLRRECVVSMGNLFEKLFAVNPFDDSACFMWWDLFIGNCFGSYHTSWDPLIVDNKDVPIQQIIFETLCCILSLDSMGCQKSALHGLSHLNHELSQVTIKNFLDNHSTMDEELRKYAVQCMYGEVQ